MATHGTKTLYGVPVRKPHIWAMRSRIVCAKKNTSGAYHFFIKCKNQCSTLVDVTLETSAKRTLCRKCIMFHRRPCAGFMKSLGSHPDIVAYQIINGNGRKVRLALIRCKTEGCDTLLQFAGRNRQTGHCQKCGHGFRKRPFEMRFNQLKKNAERRGIAVGFDLAYYARLLNGAPSYHYCHRQIYAAPHGQKAEFSNDDKVYGKNRHASGCCLDRKDSEKGYTKSNVVICCGFCNRFKGFFMGYPLALINFAAMDGDVEEVVKLMHLHQLELKKQKKALMDAKTLRQVGLSRGKLGG